MHANPTLQLIRLATHPTLTPISENTGFSENYLLMIEIINCVIVYFILPASLMKTKLLTVRKGGFTCLCNLSFSDGSCAYSWGWSCCEENSRGLLGPREEPTGASCCHEKVLCSGQQFHLRGHVSSHLGGHGSWDTRSGQGHSRKCSCGSAWGHWCAILFSSGICASVSEAVVRSWAERESGEEWKTLCGRASQSETGERNLPEAGGHSALSLRSQHSTSLCILSQVFQQPGISENWELHPCI